MNLSDGTNCNFNFHFFSPENFGRHTLHLPHIQVQLKNVFLTSIEANVRQLNAEIREESFQSLHKTLHMLKGTVGIFCVESLQNELSALAHSNPAMSKNEYLDRAKTAIASLETLAREMQSFLRTDMQSQNETLITETARLRVQAGHAGSPCRLQA